LEYKAPIKYVRLKFDKISGLVDLNKILKEENR
jgi:hypothetical protein